MTKKIARYIDVAVPLPIRVPLTYRVPVGLPGCLEPGARALVPVGRRLLTGVIVARAAEPPLAAGKTRDIAELPDDAPILPLDLLDLTLWAARYYVSSPGVMVATALPPGIGRRGELVIERLPVDERHLANFGDAARRLLDRIPEEGGVAARSLGEPLSRLRRLERAGLIRMRMIVTPARVRTKYRSVVHLARGVDPEAALASCRRAPRQSEVLRTLVTRRGEGILLDDLLGHLGDVRAPVHALIRKGLVRVRRVEAARRPPVLPSARADGPRRLTGDQSVVMAPITRAIEERASRAFLLMGVTGSGKTEIYLRSIDRCLEAGRSAIYLVPEITLTPLLARDLRARLGDRLAILHSSLSPGERFDEWRHARDGRARIVLGARSAILAPLSDVGLIIVDEEQDASYKQGEDPRYNARDLALVRGRKSGATVILGSATPSAESYHAGLSGRLELLRLPRRILRRPMARVTVIDMRERFTATGREELVSAPLQDAVRERLSRGEQAIILLNRRGYAPFVLCRECGASETCRRCSVVLTYHRGEDRLRCHYCGYWRGRPARCSTCGSEAIAMTGAGTERLEEQIERLFPDARTARLDRDVARGRRRAAAILSAFEAGEFNLLVGTQMVAKGHDFPKVTIVGVIGSDNLLALPEFRAAERTFQLLTQVAGRSGRGEDPGEVMVQAYHTDHYAIQAAARQDYELFYRKESRFRRIMKYPPFAAMANLIVQAASPEAGVRRVRKVAEVLRRKAGPDLDLFGPSVAPIARLKGKYRYQILVKGRSKRRLSDTLNDAVDELGGGTASPRDLIVDVDPVWLA